MPLMILYTFIGSPHLHTRENILAYPVSPSKSTPLVLVTSAWIFSAPFLSYKHCSYCMQLGDQSCMQYFKCVSPMSCPVVTWHPNTMPWLMKSIKQNIFFTTVSMCCYFHGSMLLHGMGCRKEYCHWKAIKGHIWGRIHRKQAIW